MRRTRTYIIYALLLIGILSCRKDEPAVEEGKVIGFSIEATPTRATFFEKEDDLKNTAKQGGNFTVNAYSSGTETAYISNQRVWYFADDDKWRFWDNATDNVTNLYWPNSGNLDFFAYMPYREGSQSTCVTIEDYTSAGGPSFSCRLPLDNEGQEKIQEFIYAYSKDQNKNSTGSDGKKGVVQLNFVHPFSALIIKLNESYRMDIKQIKICNILNEGVYANPASTLAQGSSQPAFTCASWTPKTGAERQDLVIDVNQSVPDDINYNSPIGGPYVIMPQQLTADVFLEIIYQRDGETKTGKRYLYQATLPQWDPGKKYTYTLTMGDPLEEILFNVAVEEWSVVDYKNEIGVE